MPALPTLSRKQQQTYQAREHRSPQGQGLPLQVVRRVLRQRQDPGCPHRLKTFGDESERSQGKTSNWSKA